MTDLDERLVALLRDRAEKDEMNIEGLLAGARRRGRKLRRRRNLAGTAAVMLLVAGLLSAAGTLAPRLDDVSAVPDALPRPPLTSTPVRTADLAAELGNGRVFHLDLNGFVLRAPDTVGWSSGDGREQLWVQREHWPGSEALVTFESTVDILLTLTREPHDSWLASLDGSVTSSARVRGAPATVVHVAGSPRDPARASVAWQPAPGVHAQLVIVGDVAEVLRAAALVRFDRTHRCAIPARFGPPPRGPASPVLALLPGARPSCSMYFSAPSVGDAPRWKSSNTFYAFDTWYLSVSVSWNSKPSDPPTATINGRPAYVYSSGGPQQSKSGLEIEFPDRMVYISAGPSESPEGRTPFDHAAVIALAEGYTEVPGLDPAGWPDSPLG